MQQSTSGHPPAGTHVPCPASGVVSLAKLASLAPARAVSLRPAQDDRRHHARFMLELAVTMQGDNNFYTGLTEDMSEGGIFIATHHLLPIGTKVVLSITVMKSIEPLEMRGTVRWIRGVEAMMSHDRGFYGGEFQEVKPGVGVEFDMLDAKTAATIRRFMSHRSPEFYA